MARNLVWAGRRNWSSAAAENRSKPVLHLRLAGQLLRHYKNGLSQSAEPPGIEGDFEHHSLEAENVKARRCILSVLSLLGRIHPDSRNHLPKCEVVHPPRLQQTSEGYSFVDGAPKDNWVSRLIEVGDHQDAGELEAPKCVCHYHPQACEPDGAHERNSRAGYDKQLFQVSALDK